VRIDFRQIRLRADQVDDVRSTEVRSVVGLRFVGAANEHKILGIVKLTAKVGSSACLGRVTGELCASRIFVGVNWLEIRSLSSAAFSYPSDAAMFGLYSASCSLLSPM